MRGKAIKQSLLTCLAIHWISTCLSAQQFGPDIEQAIGNIDGLGGKYHRAIVRVDFGGLATYTGDEIKKLAPLRDELRSLSLFGTAVTDKGLHDIYALQELTTLDLRRTRITDG